MTHSRPDAKAAAAAVREHLASAFPSPVPEPARSRLPHYLTPHFQVRASRKHGVTVTWSGRPTETEVSAAVVGVTDMPVALHRHRIWSCGKHHDDGMAAWRAHEGAVHEVPEYDECTHYDGTDDFFCSCVSYADYVVPDDVMDRLRSEGETFESACRPGEYAVCGMCGGDGRTVALRPRTRVEPCRWCAERGVFDLSDPADAEAHDAMLTAAVEHVAATRTRR